MQMMEMLGAVENGDAVGAEGIWKFMYLLLSFAVNNKTTPKTRETIMRSTHSCEGMEERELPVKEIACPRLGSGSKCSILEGQKSQESRIVEQRRKGEGKSFEARAGDRSHRDFLAL